MPYYGNRTLEQQKTTEQVVRHLFSNESFMTILMKDSFEIASYDKIIPQFGAESNYYSVLKYLFEGSQGNNAKGSNSRLSVPPAARGISIPGIPSAVAAYLAEAAKSAVDKLGWFMDDTSQFFTTSYWKAGNLNMNFAVWFTRKEILDNCASISYFIFCWQILHFVQKYLL